MELGLGDEITMPVERNHVLCHLLTLCLIKMAYQPIHRIPSPSAVPNHPNKFVGILEVIRTSKLKQLVPLEV